MVTAIVSMISPIIGGYLTQWSDWRAGFYFVCIVGLSSLIATYYKLPETNQNKKIKVNTGKILTNYAFLLTEKHFILYVLGISFSGSVFFAFIAAAPHYTTVVLGLSPGHYGLLSLFVSVGYMIGNYISGKYAVKITERKLLSIYTSIAIVGILSLIFLVYFKPFSALSLFIPMSFFACANGVGIPNGLSGALNVRAGIAGTASGLAGCIQILTGSITTLIVSYFHDQGILPLMYFMIVSSLLSIICFALVCNNPRKVVRIAGNPP